MCTELTAEEREAVLSLANRCTTADGTQPLNEAARFNLDAGPVARHWLIEGEGTLIAYAQLAADDTVQLCVDPALRRRRYASALREQVLAGSQGAELGWWSFGALAPAMEFSTKLGLHPGRELLIMERPLAEPLPPANFPDGVAVSTFTPADTEAWLGVNARAFAHHQEQGSITAADLAARQRESWFDADGFFLAYRGQDLLGYHWTKIHHEATTPVGEVYVLGVDPDAGRSGIGRALLNRGLAYLGERGLDTVILYVEADQRHVVDLYSTAGFDVAHRDVLYTTGEQNEQVEQGAS